MNNINNIFESINIINETTADSEIAVMESMLVAYDKAYAILENYEGEDLDAFSIFQEGKIMDDVKKAGKNDKNKIITIIKFIPRMIMAFIKQIKSKMIKHETKPLSKDEIEKVRNKIANNKKAVVIATGGLVTATIGGITVLTIAKNRNNKKNDVKKNNTETSSTSTKNADLDNIKGSVEFGYDPVTGDIISPVNVNKGFDYHIKNSEIFAKLAKKFMDKPITDKSIADFANYEYGELPIENGVFRYSQTEYQKILDKLRPAIDSNLDILTKVSEFVEKCIGMSDEEYVSSGINKDSIDLLKGYLGNFMENTNALASNYNDFAEINMKLRNLTNVVS